MTLTKDKIKTWFKEFMEWFDPDHQSFLYFPWDLWSVSMMAIFDVWLVTQPKSFLGGLLMILSPLWGIILFFWGGAFVQLEFAIRPQVMNGELAFVKERINEMFYLGGLFGYLGTIALLVYLYRITLQRDSTWWRAVLLFMLASCLWCCGAHLHHVTHIGGIFFSSLGGCFLFISLWTMWRMIRHEKNQESNEENW